MRFLSLIAVVSIFAACSSEEKAGTPAPTTPPPCNQDPWTCPTGQTCWASDQAGTFKCLNSAAGVEKGAACMNTISAPTCGDGLICLQLVGGSGGTCTTFCDRTKADRGCAAGEDCATITLQGTSSSFFACVPRATPDAGVDAPVETGTETGTDAATETDSDASTDDAATETGSDAGADTADGG